MSLAIPAPAPTVPSVHWLASISKAHNPSAGKPSEPQSHRMFGDGSEDLFGSLVRPFWFVPEGGLLEAFWEAEASSAAALVVEHPEAAGVLDSAEATLAQRYACFSLLFWREVLGLISERFDTAYQNPPPLSEPVSSRYAVLSRIEILEDAPEWALEIERVLRGIREKIMGVLPPALQQAGGDPNDAERIRQIRAAQEQLDTTEKLHAMLDGVLQTQWGRLARRWSAATPPPATVAPAEHLPSGFRHSVDFKSAYWAGERFTFTPRQAQAVQMLYDAWHNGTPELGQDAILEKLGSMGRNKIGGGTLPRQLRDHFRRSPAWKKLIIQGERRGTYRLALPDRSKRKS